MSVFGSLPSALPMQICVTGFASVHMKASSFPFGDQTGAVSLISFVDVTRFCPLPSADIT